MKKSIIYVLIVLGIVAVTVLFSGCIIGEEEVLYNEAVKLQQNESYGDAITKYQEIITNYPDSPYAARAEEAIPECYYDWANKLLQVKFYKADKAGNILRPWPIPLASYKDAITKYQEIITNYPDSPYAAKAEEAIPGCYYDWAKGMNMYVDPKATLERYCFILKNYPDSYYANKTKTELLTPSHLRIALRKPRATPELLECLYQFGLECERAGLYSEAMGAYKYIKYSAPNSEYVSRIVRENRGECIIIECRCLGTNVTGKVKNTGYNTIVAADVEVIFYKGDEIVSSGWRTTVHGIKPGEAKAFNCSKTSPLGGIFFYTDYKVYVTEVWYNSE